MTRQEKEQLLSLLNKFNEHIDDEVLDEDPLDLDIMRVCMEIPAGYEDLLEKTNG